MEKFVLLFVFIVIGSGAFASEGFYIVANGEQPDHLVPIRNSHFGDYQQKLKSKLCVGAGEINLITFLRKPSFSTEKCMILYTDRVKPSNFKEGRKYYLGVSEPNINIWSTLKHHGDRRNQSPVRVNHKFLEIGKAQAATIHRVISKLVMNTRYPKVASNGLDGETLEFSSWIKGIGTISGQAWSPKNNTIAKLTDFLENLSVLVLKDGLDSEIETSINALGKIESEFSN